MCTFGASMNATGRKRGEEINVELGKNEKNYLLCIYFTTYVHPSEISLHNVDRLPPLLGLLLVDCYQAALTKIRSCLSSPHLKPLIRTHGRPFNRA